MKRGRLDRRIVVQSYTESKDAWGQPTVTWSTFKSIWASVLHETGKEQTTDKNRTTNRMVKFTTTYISTITNSMRIVWNGDIYKIEDIKELGRGDGLQIFTSKLTQT